MAQIKIPFSKELRSPKRRPKKGKLLLLVSSSGNLVLRNWEGTEATIGLAAASLTTDMAGENNDLTLTAVTPGAAGNDITFDIVLDPDGYVGPEIAVVNGTSIETTAGAKARMQITGTLSPDATGVLVQTETAPTGKIPGTSSLSSDGGGSAPVSGSWVQYVALYLVVPETKTIDEIWPIAFANATNDQTTSSRITIRNETTGALTFYWATNNSSNPRWVLVGDGTLTNRGGDSITAGRQINIQNPSGTPVATTGGGLFETWYASPSRTFLYVLQHYTNGSLNGNWAGVGATPDTASLSALSPTTGTPTVTALAHTAAQLKTALEGSAEASALVTVEFAPGNDGSGEVTNFDATNLSGGVG